MIDYLEFFIGLILGVWIMSYWKFKKPEIKRREKDGETERGLVCEEG